MEIILADAEKEYLEILEERLMHCVPGLNLKKCTQAIELNSLISNSGPGDLLIYNPADFIGLHLPDTDAGQRLSCWTLTTGKLMTSTPGRDFKRIGSTASLVSALRQWVDESGHNPEPEYAVVPAGDRTTASCRLHFSCCFEPTGYHPDHTRKRLAELARITERIIYLPLMPTYQMICMSMPDSGLSMTDLLLRMCGQIVKPDQLGLYLQPTPAGYLQFRPPDRSDDLVTCSPETLRNLIGLLREYLKIYPGTAAALVDCAGLPLSSYAAIAVLCDTCQIILPDRECFATRSARQEAGRLMAELPSCCKIIGHEGADPFKL